MVYFVLTRSGFDDLVSSLGRIPSPMWVDAGVLSDVEILSIRADGVDLTTFSPRIGRVEKSEFEDALETVYQHPPGHSIWYEYRP